MKEERHKSFELCNTEASKKDKLLKKIRSNELQETHELFELKWAGEGNAEEYELKMNEERREGLKDKNAIASEQITFSEKLKKISFRKRSWIIWVEMNGRKRCREL